MGISGEITKNKNTIRQDIEKKIKKYGVVYIISHNKRTQIKRYKEVLQAMEYIKRNWFCDFYIVEKKYI
jgi:hypothetical protein